MSRANLPQIDYCFLCEDLRPEFGNKLNILGFYGMLPHVRVILQEWGKPVEKLMFLVGGHGSEGTIDAKATIVNPDGTLLIATEDLKVKITATAANLIVGFGFAALTFKDQGKHKLHVHVNKRLAYEQSFEVTVGDVS